MLNVNIKYTLHSETSVIWTECILDATIWLYHLHSVHNTRDFHNDVLHVCNQCFFLSLFLCHFLSACIPSFPMLLFLSWIYSLIEILLIIFHAFFNIIFFTEFHKYIITINSPSYKSCGLVIYFHFHLLTAVFKFLKMLFYLFWYWSRWLEFK